jgi:hypothetical protein
VAGAPSDARGSLNADDLRGPVLITFLADRLPRPFLAAEDAELLDQAIREDAADLMSELPAGVQIRGARMSVGRGAGTVLPAIELFRAVTDDAARLAFWAGTGIAFAEGVRRAYGYVTARMGKQLPLLSPEALIHLAASEVLEGKDAPEHLQFVSITSVHDLHHAYSTSPYLPYDYGDVFVIILTAAHDQSDYIYGFVMAADGTMSYKWSLRVDHNGHPV